MSDIVPIRPPLYAAKKFTASSVFGEFQTSGTLCGEIDFAIPKAATYPITLLEAESIILALSLAVKDVRDNSNPTTDPRILV